MTQNEQNRVRFGPFEADLRTHELWKMGVRLKLAGQPFQVLEVLLERPGELVTRDELKERMWPGDTFVDFGHGLNAAVNKLREALSDSAENPKYIETLPRRGYRFIGEVERGSTSARVPAEETRATAVSAQPPVEVTQVAPMPPENSTAVALEPEVEAPRRKRTWWKVVFALGGLGLVIVFVMAIVLMVVRFTSRDERGPALQGSVVAKTSDPLSDPAFSPNGNELVVRREGKSPSTTGLFIQTVGDATMRQLTRSALDCCAAYSPDGKMIAFSRMGQREYGVYVVDVDGKSERKIYSSGQGRKDHGEVGWTPDGKGVLFSDLMPNGGSSIFSVSIDELKVNRLTNPPPGSSDRSPSYSPDGQNLVFVRSQEDAFADALEVMSAQREVWRVTSQPGRIIGAPAWSADSQSILYTSMEEQGPQIWRVAVSGGDPTRVPQAGQASWHPAVSRRGYRFAFQQTGTMSSLWRIDLTKPDDPAARVELTRSDRKNEGPQLSPDGKRIAFMSDRSGSMEIWVCAADGSNATQLSALGKAGTPRWSPDSKTVAFDSDAHGYGEIYVVNADGGEPRVLIQGNYSNVVPSWSHDGRWIYFASDRNKGWQVWKMNVNTGAQVQVTGGGGFAAWESADGSTLYYAKTMTPDPAIWKVSVSGGLEIPVSQVVPRIWAAWSLGQNGIYYVPESEEGDASIRYFDFATEQSRRLSLLTRAPFWLSVTSDGKAAFVGQVDQNVSNVVVVENFH